MEARVLVYEVTARKWRPQEFDSVVGQEHVTTTLRNAIKNQQIAHAYLFSGPRGVGKTTTARILAKALNCENGPTVNPCNTCSFCREISEGNSVDVLEIDGASNNRVEQVRTHLLESVKYRPSQGKHKIYIIDEVHMLTKEAFNALLKTLEEPPSHVYFIFATTDPRKVIPTVLSRCQRFDFRRISGTIIVDHLDMISKKSGYNIQQDTLSLIARRVDGSLRDAESLLDQIVAFGGPELNAGEAAKVLGVVDQDVYFTLLDIVAKKDVSKCLELIDQIFREGYDLEEIVLGILEHIRNLLVVKATSNVEALLDTAILEVNRYKKQAEVFEIEDLLRLAHIASQMEESVKSSALPRVQLETGIVRMARIGSTVQLATIISRLSELAQTISEDEGITNSPQLDTKYQKNTSGLNEEQTPPADELSPPADELSSVRKSSTSISENAPTPNSSSEVLSPEETEGQTPQVREKEDRSQSIVLDILEIQKQWPMVLQEIHEKRNVLGSLLAEARISNYTPGTEDRNGESDILTLAFTPLHHFHKEQIEKRDAVSLIEAVCSKLWRKKVRLVCEIDDKHHSEDTSNPDEIPEKALKKSSSNEENDPAGAAAEQSIMRIVDAFDGEVIRD